MAVILVTNDDGINALGIRVLVKVLASRGHKIYVAAPECQRSGAGKSVLLRANVKEVENYPGAVKAWAVKAPPASIVYIAIRALLDEEPDLVVSGLNHGPNMGFEDFFTSGTIGAAIEASLMGYKSIASSVAKWMISNEEEALASALITLGVAEGLLEEDYSRGKAAPMFIVNSPVTPKGVLLTRMAWNTYSVEVKKESESIIPWMEFEKIYDLNAPEGTDIWAIINGYASITPVDLVSMHEAMSSPQHKLRGEKILEKARQMLEDYMSRSI